ncbi:ferritin-like domain-containing protein [Jeongeupia naejangsanensis]|uniref:Long-chain fatty aldehyde decarbonylase n=1 Tax=Jeongeupia naejangsanensis TaxID=613195 RepID=A0ABS2BN45_9NEIS|nr:Phenylacetic acid catabolic protein [Jeongeupia naejangsanensis]MBM3117045.1 long-chain fatty aldehyde decarbonylase [Jeongeupia naejangsanensis]
MIESVAAESPSKSVTSEVLAQEKFVADDWDPSRFDVQHWLERAPWRTLRDTRYGIRPDIGVTHHAVHDDKLVNQIYKLDIATFLTAERVSYTGIAKLMQHAPDEASQVFLATQTVDETRHYEVFCERLAQFGVSPQQRDQLMEDMTTKELRSFYDLIREQVDKGDFAAAMMAHNIILEGMAYPIYRYESAYWSVFDPSLSQLIRGAFSDEVHHVRFGEAIISRYTKLGDASRNRMQRLASEFHKLMTDVFESSIQHYIHLYQLVTDQYMEEVGDIEIFQGKKIRDVSEKDQAYILMEQIQQEHQNRMQRIGL